MDAALNTLVIMIGNPIPVPVGQCFKPSPSFLVVLLLDLIFARSGPARIVYLSRYRASADNRDRIAWTELTGYLVILLSKVLGDSEIPNIILSRAPLGRVRCR